MLILRFISHNFLYLCYNITKLNEVLKNLLLGVCCFMFAEKFAYFFIAFAVFILLKALVFYRSVPMVNILFYISMAISLLCSNIPRVVDIPLHYAYPIKTVEYFTFFVSLICFIVLCFRHIF